MFMVSNEAWFKQNGFSDGRYLQKEWWTTCPKTDTTSLHAFLQSLKDAIDLDGSFAGGESAACATLITAFATQANVAKVVANP